MLLIAGLCIFGLIFLNLDSLLNLLPKGAVIREAKYVIFLLGAAKLIDLATSINGHIINFSKYYRFGLYSLIFLGALNILLNLIFVDLYRINGIALATLVSLALYNVGKLIYVYYRFRLLPFTKRTWQACLLAISSILLAWLIPGTGIDLLDMVLKTTIFLTTFLGPVLYFRFEPDINSLVEEYLGRIKGWLGGSGK